MSTYVTDQLRELLGNNTSKSGENNAPLDFSRRAKRVSGTPPKRPHSATVSLLNDTPTPRAKPRSQELSRPVDTSKPLDFSKRAINPKTAGTKLERFGQNSIELLKGIPAGAGGLFGSAAKGLPALDIDRALRTSSQDLNERIASIPDMSEDEFESLLKEAKKLPTMAAVGFRRTALMLRSGRMTSDEYRQSVTDMVPLNETPAVKAGDWITENSDIFPAAPGYEDSTGRNLGQGLGSVAAGVATTLATGGFGGAAVFTLSGSGEALQRAVDFGATDEQILEAARAGAVPGLTDQIPIETLLKSGISPSRWPILAVAAAKIGKQAIVEGLQEGGQEFLQNLIAKEVYNPDQELTEGLPGSAGLGAGVGAITEGVNQGARLLAGRRGRGQTNTASKEADAQEPSQESEAAPSPELEAPTSASPLPDRAGSEADGAVGAVEDQQPAGDEQIALLTAAGYDLEDIQDMSAEERQIESDDLKASGVKPDYSALAKTAKGAGTRSDPAQVSSASDIDRASSQANTDPTQAQKEAGNYAKGHIKLNGLDIAIENPKGSERSGRDADGQEWSVTLPGAYGYIKRTEGADGDQVDVFIGDNPNSDFVLVIDQVDPSTKRFDEHKAILGTANFAEALKLYKSSYTDNADARIGASRAIPMEDFKKWARSGDTSKPFTLDQSIAEPEATTQPTEEQQDAFKAYVENSAAGKLSPETVAKALNTDAQQAGRLLAQASARGEIRHDNSSGQYSRKPKQKGEQSLMQALAAKGGIRDEGGELSAIGVNNKMVPGQGRLVRKGGMSLDSAREFAVEAGYLQDKGTDGGVSDSTVRDLLDALDTENRGEKVTSQQAAAQDNYNREEDEIFVESEIERIAAEYGVSIAPEDLQLATKYILDDGMTVEDAIERAAMTLGREAEPQPYEELDIPFEGKDDFDKAFDAALDDVFDSETEQNNEPDQPQETSADRPEPGPESRVNERQEADENLADSREGSQSGGQNSVETGRETGNKTDVAKSAPEHRHNVGKPLDETSKYEPVATGSSKTTVDSPVIRQEITDDAFLEITDQFAEIFETPDKQVRLEPLLKRKPFVTLEQAKQEIEAWKANARTQGKTHRAENSQKTILSLFDLTGEWSKPWEEAGYNVVRFDIQSGQDVMDFDVGYFNDNYDFGEVYGVLAACPCTDFASSGARWFKDKDADGRTEASKELVFQTMRTIEYFRPAMWALENPVGRIESVTGLPPYRLSFHPNHFGEPYTKKTVLFGNFETNLPTAKVEPTEGSKMWRKYGGKSQATKNARSETPEGFAYAFFQANNAVDMPVDVLLPKQYPEASGAVKAALQSGVPVTEVKDILYDTYENYEYDEAIRALHAAAKGSKPFVVESGADNKPQTVLPGAERITDKEQAEREAAKPLKSDKEQKDAGGLFGDIEQDLFDKPAPKAANKLPEATDTPASLKYLFGRTTGGSEQMAQMFEGKKPTNKQVLDAFNRIVGNSRTGTSLQRGSINSFKNSVEILRPDANEKPERVKIKGTELATAIRSAYASDIAEGWTDRTKPIPSRQEIIDQGRKAFKDGQKGHTPAEVLDEYGIEGAKLWQQGWSAANLDAPIEKGNKRSESGKPPSWLPKVGELIALSDGKKSFPYTITKYTKLGDDWLFSAKDQNGGGYTDGIEKLRLPAKTKVSSAAKSAVKNTAMGMGEVAKGLNALFNDPKKIGSGPAFDEETYKKALPYFKAAAGNFSDAASDVADIVALAVKSLKENFGFTRDQVVAMRPYLRRFIDDIKTGKETFENVSDSNADLEQDSGNAVSADAVGKDSLSDAGNTNGRGAGSSGGRSTQSGRTQQGNPSVSASNAPLMGEGSNPEVSDAEQSSLGSNADRDGGGSRARSSDGISVDQDGVEEAISRAGKTADDGQSQRLAAQSRAENVDIKVNDEQNIRDTLPVLFPLQQDDVIKTEKRFFGDKPGLGMLFTNGTGTGKTFTGLGVIKRFSRRGKNNILIAAPSQTIMEDWISSAEALGLEINALPDTVSSGSGIVITTYANMESNNELIKRGWDLVVADESHKLMSNGKFESTGALDNLRAMTRHPEGKWEYHKRKRAADYAKLSEMGAVKSPSDQQLQAIESLRDKLVAFREPDYADFAKGARKPVVFLSATPFPYDKSIDYAEGYLFDYDPLRNERMGDNGYNVAQGREKYFVQHFGYRMRYNKLTQPEADVDSGLMQRKWHEDLRKTGALSGRQLEVEADYERKFALVESQDGKKIDQAFDFLTAPGNDKFRPIYELVQKRFDYLHRAYLLEAIKARSAIPIIKKHHALGRKVVVFHEFNKGGGFNPFDIQFNPDEEFSRYSKDMEQIKENAQEVFDEFLALNPYVSELDFSGYGSPIETLSAAFPKIMIFNGKASKKDKAAMKKKFNDDGSDSNLITINSAAGEAGISLHDTTGDHQRVIINLGLPNRPVTAIQTEGRIYRVGQITDAIFIYMDTGTNWERFAFAQKMATRSGTAENLALGNLARNLRQSYIDGYLESDIYTPSNGEGKGGKDADRPAAESITPFDEAKTYYFAKQKIRAKRNQRAGNDYFATAEPLGLKMVEWAQIEPGDEVLEPSAGHGAISRFFPEGTNKRIIEPSAALSSEAALNTPGADVVQSTFEDHNIVNKYDAVVMNPPFGSGGSTAIKHLDKAFTHLRDGGRVVALIPTGPSADKKFDTWYEGLKHGYMVGEVLLPQVAFERAGTKIAARVVIIDKQTKKENVDKLPQSSTRTYTGVDNIKEFFDRIEQGSDMPTRIRVVKEETKDDTEKTLDPVDEALDTEATNGYLLGQTNHAKKGFPVFVAQVKDRVARDRFMELRSAAKQMKGWYSSFSRDGAIPGFQFKSEQARDAFVEENPTDAREDVALSLAEPEYMQPLTPLAESDARTIEARVESIIRDIAGPNVDILMTPSLQQFANNSEAIARSGGEIGNTPAGAYRSPINPSIRPIIHIALSLGNDPRVTSAHEAWHHLEFSGLVSPMEMAVMTREDKRLRAFVAEHVFKTDTSDPKIGGMPTYEVRAYAFQEYFRRRIEDGSPTGIHIAVRKFFDRLFQMFRRIRNALSGMGYRTTEDIFQSALRGDMKKRSSSGRRRINEGGDLAFATHQQKTGSQSTSRANYTLPGEEPALPNWLLGRMLNRFLPQRNEIITKVQDRFHQVDRLQKEVREALGLKETPEHVDTYLAESLYYGRTGERLNSLRQRHIEPLTTFMHENDVSMEELNDYLYARHAPERNAAIASINPDMPDGGSGMSNKEATALLAKFAAKDNFNAMKEAAKKVDVIIEKSRKTLADNGLISPQTQKEWSTKYSFYVPLRGFENDPDTNMEFPATGRGFDVRGKESQQALGRRSKAEQPLLFAVQQAETAIIRAEKNKVAKTFLRFIKKHPNPDLFEVARAKRKRRYNPASGMVEEFWIPPSFSNEKNLFAVKIGGRLTWVQIHHPGLAAAMRHMGSENLGAIGSALAKITRYLAMINTSLNPEFVVSNMARDLQTALVNVSETEQKGIRRQIVKAIPKALKGVYRGSNGKRDDYWTKRYGEFTDNGGKISFHSMQNIDSIRSDLEGALKNKSALRSALRGTFDWIDRANGAVENALRLATYDALIKRSYTPAKASSVARELTVNFNRKGEWGAVINAMYLFFNAALQGTVRMGLAMYRSPTARKMAVGMVGAGIAIDYLNYLIAGDDDDGENFYDKIPQWEKERNFIFMIPGSQDGKYLKFPLAYGYNVFPVMGQQIASVSRGAVDVGAGAGNMVSAMLNAFMPIGVGASPLQTITPTVARPFVEIAENKNWFGGPIYPTEYPNSYQPSSSSSFQSISPPYKWMAEGLNRATGGNEVRSGLIDFSPEVFEHLVNFSTGGAGTFWLDRLPNSVVNIISDDEWIPEKTPFVRRVFNKKSEYVDKGTYYDMRDDVMALRYEIREFSETGNDKAVQRAQNRNPALTEVIPYFVASEKQIRRVNKDRRAMLEDKNMDSDRRDKYLADLEQQRLDIMREARKSYYEAKEKL